jgi:hypothetical protein
MSTHADIASRLVANLPPGVFGRVALDAVMYEDFGSLKHMLPGVEFSVAPLEHDCWELRGRCADGSLVVWMVGD